jgi:peptidoglycan DL-endopeptidase CwlO
VAVGFARAETPAINKAKSQAEALREQIDQLDAQVEAAVEEYDTANARLDQTDSAIAENEKKLATAEADLADVQARLSDRLVEIYKEGHLGVLDTLVGSASFSDLVNRLNLMERLSKQDSDLIAQVEAYREEVTTRKAQLSQQLADQKQYLAEASTAEQKVKDQLAAKQKALAGKEKQIAQLEKEEAARQAQLAAEAKRAAEEARKAREAAAAAAATTTTHRTTTTAHSSTTSAHTTTTKPTTGTDGGTTTTERTTTTKRTTTTTKKATTNTTDAPSSGGAVGGDVVDYALRFLGTAYVWGGSTPSGFDCSGFTMYVYRHFGHSLPHSSSMQSGYGVAVARSDLEPGDLVFFYSPVHHVGIYIGGGKMVNAAGTGKGVRIDYLWSSYNCGRRIIH